MEIPGDLVKMHYNLTDPEWGMRFYMSNKPPGDADDSGLWTTLWGARFHSSAAQTLA